MNKEIIYELLCEIGIESQNIDDDTDLIAGSLLDSMSLIALISLMEERLGIVLNTIDYDIDNFRNVHSLFNLIGKYRR